MPAGWDKLSLAAPADDLIGFTDLLATFADITDHQLANTSPIDSESFLPILVGKKDSVRSSLIIEDRAVRKGPWKLIFDYGMGGVHRNYRPAPDSSEQETQGKLYNLNNDRSE